ncbi:MAG: precorrin-6y C5,15-methyltransferase (decarboxylating) subunit CbiE [Nocardioides sp.]
MTSPPPSTFVVAAVCLRDERGRILTVRKRGTGAFMLPGGKIEPGETPAQTAVREIEEEVGLRLDHVEPLGHFVADAANEPGHLVDSEVFTAEHVGEPVRAGEIDELRWLDPGDLDGFGAPIAPLLRGPVLAALSPVTVVGVGADGWRGLAESVRARVLAAPVLVGGRRQLDLVPPVAEQERVEWPSPFAVDLVDGYPGRPVLVLASGDPLVSGVGTTLVRRFGAARVEVVPAVSSVALARARMRWSAEETAVVTVVGRHHETLLRELAPGRRVLVLSSDAASPATIARLLTEAGFGASSMTVLGDLGSDHETRIEGVAATWQVEVPALTVVAIECEGSSSVAWASGLPDDVFEHDGQLTKRDLRASALARLAPRPAQLLWDVGAGAGSIGIEWMRAHPSCRAVAVEADPARAERIGRNAASLGVPDLQVVMGRAPAALEDLAAPDAIFVGGGATALGLLDRCVERLRPGGRLVVHGVTLETEAVLAAAFAEHGGELTRHSIEHAEPIGGYSGWKPARPIVQWCWSKP